MSAPSTPRASGAASPIAWTPEATHTANDGETLTPRRKYQQLMAQFDDSDDELPTKPARAVFTEKRVEIVPRMPVVEEQSLHSASDSDDSVHKPVGRMAARMMRKAGSEVESPASVQSGGHQEASSPSKSSVSDHEPTSKPTRRFKQRSTSPVSANSRQSSPGLFVTPTKSSRHDSVSGSESEAEDFVEIKNTKFKELLAAKRDEKRAAKKAAKKTARKTAKKAAKQAAKNPEQSSATVPDDFIVDDTDDNADDDEAGHKLTQSSKPMRKASKKALEEINRETQRMARNQYLAHQATVKSKVTKFDLFKRFNFRQDPAEKPKEDIKEPNSEDDFVMSGALVSSDAENGKELDTPASSPPSGNERNAKEKESLDRAKSELPLLQDSLSEIVEKSKQDLSVPSSVAAAPALVSFAEHERMIKTTTPTKVQKQVRVVLPKITRILDDDSDDGLVIEKPTASEILKHVPSSKTRESNSLMTLRHLANLNSPGKKRPKGGDNMTASELFTQLRVKARRQALTEKEERIRELRAKGIHVETAEERERAQLDMENLLERAREEAQLLAKKEKDAAKRDGKTDGDELFDDDSDEEFEDKPEEDTDEEVEEEEELELSEDEEDEEDEAEVPNPLFDQEAEEDDKDESEDLEILNTLTHSKRSPEPTPHRDASPVFKKPAIQPRNRKVVLDDDEDADDAANEISNSTADETAAVFGFKSFGDGLGLSQVFAGTIGANAPHLNLNGDEESMDFFANIPGTMPQFGDEAANLKFFPQTQQESAAEISQTPEVHLGISQFQSLPLERSPSTFSELPEPSQDVGFRTPHDAFRKLASTMDTVLMQSQETPVPKKRRQLKRRSSLVAILSEDETGSDNGGQEDEDFVVSKDAFSALFKAAKKKSTVDTFDKKKSAAKGLVEDQAEESEDEYAGLGGASDDESAGELDEETRNMIDEGPIDVDEQQLAAFHA
jgi:mediator of replication checkpoint protein 1